MTDEDLAAFEHLANNATPGPWTTEKPGKTDDGWSKGVRICAAMNNPVYGDPPGGQSPWADAQFIAAARSASVELIAEVKRLRVEVEKLRCQTLSADLVSAVDDANRLHRETCDCIDIIGGNEKAAEWVAAMRRVAGLACVHVPAFVVQRR